MTSIPQTLAPAQFDALARPCGCIFVDGLPLADAARPTDILYRSARPRTQKPGRLYSRPRRNQSRPAGDGERISGSGYRTQKMTPTELREWQTQMGLTTYTAADALGVCRRTYSRWVTGEAPISRITALACAALLAGIDVPTGKEPKKAKTTKNSRNYLDFSGW